MQVELTSGCVRISPKLRKIAGHTDKKTGQVYPARVLDKWTKPCILDWSNGELISRSEYRSRASRHNAFCDSFGEYRETVRKIWSDRRVNYPRPVKRDSCKLFGTTGLRRLKVASWQVKFDYMITLTYPGSPDWQTAKRDLNRYLTWLRSIGVDKYLWVLERQKRGSIHFHLIIENGKHCNLLRRRVAFHNGNKQCLRPFACVAWGRCIGVPMRFWCSVGRFERIRSAKDARSYVGKYLSKGVASENVAEPGKILKPNERSDGRKWGSHQFRRTVSRNPGLVRAIFRIKQWQVKDTIIGCESDEITTDLIRKLFNQFEGKT